MTTIRTMTNQDPDFYTVMGPFLSRREIVDALGAPVWDDDDRTWFVAADADGQVQGFCAAADKTNHVAFASAYVLPAHRDQGVYAALLDARMQRYAGRACKVTVRRENAEHYEARGFTPQTPRGGFITLKREPEQVAA